jgi:sigma-B regulation protein RsbU (phosphoserine phosphatase)
MMTAAGTSGFSMPPMEQQLEAVLGTLSSDQRRLLWLSQGKGFTASEIQSSAPVLGMPEVSSDEGYQMLGELCELALRYLKELENSVNVQQKLLPESPPDIAGVDIAVRYLPMLGVSGDYYDFLPAGEGKVGAAMLMASVRASLRAQVQANPTAIGKLLSHLNRTVHNDAPRSSFVTLIYGILDTNSYTFTYSAAGHPPVLHYQASTGEVRELDSGGGVLGMWGEMEYPTETISLEIGDALVLHTDGIIEASDASEEVFGMERLCAVVAAYGDGTSEALQGAVLDAALQFAHQGWEDDVTVMVVKRRE